MKIMVLASNWRKVAPDCMSAPERIASQIADGLFERGHDVTLAASGDSITKGKLFSVTEKASFEDETIGRQRHIDYEFYLIEEAIKYANENNFDIINSHFDSRSAIMSGLSDSPVVSTLHSPIDKNIYPIMLNYQNSQSYISISDSQREGAPGLNYRQTIYHGIEIEKFSPNYNHGDYYLSIGRLIPDKGFLEAIDIAKRAGVQLHIIGRPHPDHLDYLENIKKQLDENITLKTDVPFEDVPREYSNAKALIFPLSWEEPFGLTMVEAMASGTPVVAFDRGSVKEVLGDTGFISSSGEIESMIDHVHKIESMSENENIELRKSCRKRVEDNFTKERMIDNYEKLFESINKEK